MIERRPWFERKFDFGLSLDLFPSVIERLRGTPGRMAERVDGLDVGQLTKRVEGRWSIQENAGHLLILEDLWIGRLEDVAAGLPRLRPADLTNRATDQSDFNSQEIGRILESFAIRRAQYVTMLEAMSAEEAQRTALHPRLDQPMRVLDQAFFAAEHDDHHLARITQLRRILLEP